MGAQTELRAPGDTGHDTINTRVIPIVLVPGVMGTRLDIDDAAVDWDPDDHAQMLDWVASSTGTVRERISAETGADLVSGFPAINLEQGPDVDPVADIEKVPRVANIATKGKRMSRVDRHRTIRTFWEKRGWGSLVWTFYGEMLLQLANELNPTPNTSESHPVYACGYDWRQSCEESGNTLVAFIDQVFSEQPFASMVVVVTHSMGGLVTRAALLQGATDKIGGVVHTVIPADGAVVAYRRFFTGASAALGDGDAPLCKILGDSPEEYHETQSGARGPIELLPHDSYPDEWLRFPGGTNKTQSDVFALYSGGAPPGLVQEGEFASAVRARLGEASTFTRKIAGVFHPRTFLLLGNQTQTDLGYDWTRPPPPAPASGAQPPSPPPPPAGAPSNASSAPAQSTLPASNPIDAALGQRFMDRRPAGDGTVPAPSAEFRASKPKQRDNFNVQHAECFRVPAFRDAVVNRVRRILAEL